LYIVLQQSIEQFVPCLNSGLLDVNVGSELQVQDYKAIGLQYIM
jgi:hypothetical protein